MIWFKVGLRPNAHYSFWQPAQTDKLLTILKATQVLRRVNWTVTPIDNCKDLSWIYFEGSKIDVFFKLYNGPAGTCHNLTNYYIVLRSRRTTFKPPVLPTTMCVFYTRKRKLQHVQWCRHWHCRFSWTSKSCGSRQELLVPHSVFHHRPEA